MIVTTFDRLLDTKTCKHVEHDKIFHAIRTGGKLAKSVQEIRQLIEIDPDKANEEKKKLPGICFGGKFSKRSNDSLIESSGLMILDFDKTALYFDEELKKDPRIYACWLSPSGTGYKALVKIPVVADDREYKRYFYSVQKVFPTVDQSGKDISRFCFFSFDPTIYVNAEAKTWEIDETIEVTALSTGKKYQQTKTRTDHNRVIVGLKMIQTAQVGNVHETIVRAGKLMGGYIAGGQVDESDVLVMFENEVRNQMKNPRDFAPQWKSFLDGIEYGKVNPIDSVADATIENKIGDVAFILDGDIAEKLRNKYKNGKVKVYHVGWGCMKDHYVVVLGGTTYLYGSPFTGKSQWWFEVLINLSIFYGMVHAVCSPETGDAVDVFEELVQIYIGRDFTNNYGNQMTVLEMEKAIAFIKDHFFIIDAEEAGVDLSPIEYLDYVDTLERKHNKKIHTVTADPWNEFRHDMSEGAARDLYMDNQLKLVRRHAKKNDRHVCLITHTTDQDKPITKGKETYYPVPRPRDIAWGKSWHRKGMMMLAFWRHSRSMGTTEIIEIEGTTIHHNTLIIQVQKIKPKGICRPGKICLYYDAKEHKYYEGGAGPFSKSYAQKIEDSEKEPVKKMFVDHSSPEHDIDALPF